MKLATWNVNSLAVRLAQVLDWLQANPVDVLALQELKLTDDKFPLRRARGRRLPSAVASARRPTTAWRCSAATPLADVVRNIPGFDDEQARVIAATVDGSGGPIRVISAYFANGQAPEQRQVRLQDALAATALRDWVRAELARHPRLVLMGDFNIAPEDRDVYDPVGLGRADPLHDAEERAHFRALLDLGLADAFRLFEQPPKSWQLVGLPQCWPSARTRGLRIDHILVSEALRPQVSACIIDKLPRKNERPSDHAPVIVELRD